jgi:hypothetical protein
MISALFARKANDPIAIGGTTLSAVGDPTGIGGLT